MMFGQNMDLWKLDTPADYLNFFVVAALFIIVIYFSIRKINKGRNDESAAKRVAKKLKLKPKEGILINDVSLTCGDRDIHFDHLLLDRAGITAMRTIGYGTRIYGAPDDAEWAAVDNNNEKRMIPNPIKAMESDFEPLKRILSKSGIYNVSLTPLAIFADPFDNPELYLGRDSSSIIFADLPKWKKQRILRGEAKAAKGEGFDYSAAASCLEQHKK